MKGQINFTLRMFILFSVFFYHNHGYSDQRLSTDKVLSDITQLNLLYKDEVCSVRFFMPINESRERVEYSSKSKKHNGTIYCSVHIPKSDFKRHFNFCALTGISQTSDSSGKIHMDFAGGSSREEEGTFYFEWYDAKEVTPYYSCF